MSKKQTMGKQRRHLHPEFVKGAVCAATIAEGLQGRNEYLLEDRILLKLNIITKSQLRKYSSTSEPLFTNAIADNSGPKDRGVRHR